MPDDDCGEQIQLAQMGVGGAADQADAPIGRAGERAHGDAGEVAWMVRNGERRQQGEAEAGGDQLAQGLQAGGAEIAAMAVGRTPADRQRLVAQAMAVGEVQDRFALQL